jgi:hypothetical protein
MSMDRQTIEASMKQARQFLTAGRLALERLDAEVGERQAYYDERARNGWDGPRPAPGASAHDRSYGSKETGALRRSSMDLTRKLAELRKP